MYVTTANSGSACKYTATCSVFDSSTQSWIGVSSWSKGGISCDTAGIWTVNIPTTNTNYNPSYTATMRVIYEITDSQVALSLTPSRQVISQFNLNI